MHLRPLSHCSKGLFYDHGIVKWKRHSGTWEATWFTLSREISSTKQLPIKTASILTQEVIRSSTLLTVTNKKIVHQTPDGRLYYNVRNGKNFSVLHVNKENSSISEHYYRQNKSKPFLKRLIGKIKAILTIFIVPILVFSIHLAGEIVICSWNLTAWEFGKGDANPYIPISQKKNGPR